MFLCYALFALSDMGEKSVFLGRGGGCPVDTSATGRSTDRGDRRERGKLPGKIDFRENKGFALDNRRTVYYTLFRYVISDNGFVCCFEMVCTLSLSAGLNAKC